MSLQPVRHDPVSASAGSLDDALLAAEQVLADTFETVNPEMPALDLLSCAERFRAHLSALAAACRSQRVCSTVNSQATSRRAPAPRLGSGNGDTARAAYHSDSGAQRSLTL
jgi:hypothetical protein